VETFVTVASWVLAGIFFLLFIPLFVGQLRLIAALTTGRVEWPGPMAIRAIDESGGYPPALYPTYLKNSFGPAAVVVVVGLQAVGLIPYREGWEAIGLIVLVVALVGGLLRTRRAYHYLGQLR
jgi:hypothetical protein